MAEARPVGFQDVAALVLRQVAGEGAPGFRRELAQAIEEPVDLRPAAQEDAAQRQAAHAGRVMLGIGDGKGGAP
jgi:hypothetical protein